MTTSTRKPTSGTLRLSTESGLVEFITKQGREEYLSADHQIRVCTIPEDKLLAMALLEEAKQIARQRGFRMIGRWEREGDDSWSAPIACGPTPTRTVRIEDPLWERAKRKATQQNTNVSAIIVEAIQKFVNEEIPEISIDLLTGVYTAPTVEA